jgi:uncharacterized membrane protein (UPF0127 family)
MEVGMLLACILSLAFAMTEGERSGNANVCLCANMERAGVKTVSPPLVPPAEDETPKEKVSLGIDEATAEEFELELAVTPAERERGLMEREEIDEHGGMLFIYPEPGQRGFWMKNCLIDIDMIFLDEEGRITAVHAAKKELPRQPGESEWDYEDRLKRYPSRRPAQFCIEVQAGTIKRLGLKAGQLVELDVERLSKLAEN